MKNALGLLALSAVLGCGGAESLSPEQTALQAPLVGRWKLVELRSDIGNGRSTYQPVDGFLSETITFRANGRYVVESSNRVSHAKQFWFYRVLDDERLEMVYIANTAERPTSTWRYTDRTDSTLTLHYGCVEACSGKYVRVK
jgi:hypothetical protein